MTQNHNNDQILPLDTRLFYAAPAFVLALPAIPIWILLPAWYGEDLGLGLALAGGILLALRLVDMISDPLIGWLSDHWPGPGGRRKGPITLGALIAAPALYALMSPPDMEPSGLGIWLGVWGFLLYLGWTAVQIPWLAWAGELAPNWHIRSQLHGWREGLGLCGLLAVGVWLIATTSLGKAMQYQGLAICALVLGLPAIIGLVTRVPDGKSTTRLRQKLQFPAGNKLFLRLLTAWFVNGFANALPAICLPLFITHILGASDQDMGIALFLYFAMAVAGIPFWLWLAERWGKHRSWSAGMAFSATVFLSVAALGSGDIVFYWAICALTGLALGSDLVLPPSLQNDCADYDRWRFDQDRQGQIFAWWSMSTKLAPGLAVGLAFPLLDYLGLENSPASPAALDALIVFYAVIPVILKLLTILLVWQFPLTRHHHKTIRARLQQRDAHRKRIPPHVHQQKSPETFAGRMPDNRHHQRLQQHED